MPRTLSLLRLSEVSTVRVVCKHDGCGVGTELPVGQLIKLFGKETVSCPHCNGILCRAPAANHFGLQNIPLTPLFMLAHAAEEAAKQGSKFDIEFVLPDSTAG